ncbi:MAG TPA: hypothetical protein VFB68_10305 [Xanthobacteraceae bacterium]|nr:hypothetical protein [Xanthobacteraceae bacterium]
MSLAQILGHLRTGDVIIVRDNGASQRLRRSVLGRVDAMDGNTFDSRKLLRNLIAVRHDGVKKK